ncbi:hypothetical protein ES703_39539 [subsurface metagenome]
MLFNKSGRISKSHASITSIIATCNASSSSCEVGLNSISGTINRSLFSEIVEPSGKEYSFSYCSLRFRSSL